VKYDGTSLVVASCKDRGIEVEYKSFAYGNDISL
jgi:hypothetical protein